MGATARGSGFGKLPGARGAREEAAKAILPEGEILLLIRSIFD